MSKIQDKDWGSNVQPKNFGKGAALPQDWDCICGKTNKGTVRYTRAGREVCQLCGMDRETAEQAMALGDRCSVCEGYEIPGATHTGGITCSHGKD